MNREQISEAARTLQTARFPNRRAPDTKTIDLFPGEPHTVATSVPSSGPSGVGEGGPARPVRKKRAAAPDAGAALRDQGIARAATSSGDEWQERALRLVRIHATNHSTLTCDGMRLWVEATGFDRPPDARAWGAVMLRAKREAIVEPTDRFEVSADPACHKSPVRVWRSLVCGAA